MADLFSTIGQNYKTKAGNGLGPRTVIIKLAKGGAAIAQADLDDAVRAIKQGGTYSGETNDAFTVAGISAFTAASSTAVFLALQGTGTINADASNALGVTDLVLTVETTFDQTQA
jgi:hypothetical protein